MYTLAQSGPPTRKIAAGRYGEDDPAETPRKSASPPCPRPERLSVEANRYQSAGDVQPKTSPMPRVNSGGDDEPLSPPTPAMPQEMPSSLEQQEQLLRQQHQQHLHEQFERHEDFNPLFFREPTGSPPPQTILCSLSRTSSIVSEISINEREWVLDDSSSGSESNSVQKHMVSAEDWEGIILAASRPEIDLEEPPQPLLPKLRAERPSNTYPYSEGLNEADIAGLKGEDDSKHRRRRRNHGGNGSSGGNHSDLSSGPEILDESFHAPLSPPQRKPSLPPQSLVPNNNNKPTRVHRDIDLREFAALNIANDAAAPLHPTTCVSMEPSLAEDHVADEPAWKILEDVTPSTATSTLSHSFHRGKVPEMPELSDTSDPDYCHPSETSFHELMMRETTLRPEELRIEGMSDEEMLQMALQASKQDYEEREQILAALQESDHVDAGEEHGEDTDDDYDDEEQILNDRAIAYSLEACLALPTPQRPPVSQEPKPQKRSGVLQSMLRRRRGGRNSTSTS